MSQESLTDGLRETLAVFERSEEPRTTPEVADRLGLGRRTTYARLERLVERGRLETKRVGASARVWWRPTTSGTDWSMDAESLVEDVLNDVEGYAIFTLDDDGYVRTWNSGAERIKGYEAEEILGEHFSTFYSEAAREDGVPAANLARAAEEGSVEDEGWRLHRDGSTFWANVTITAVRDDDELQGYVKVTRDMTDRQEYEQRLREERDFTKQILETAPASIFVLDSSGEVVTANDRFREQLGVDEPADELSVGDLAVYDDTGTLVPPGERPYRTVFETGEGTFDWQCQIGLPDGRRRWASVNVAPIADDGDVERVVVTAQDVTQLRRQERQLRGQRDELRAELDDVYDRIDDGFFALDEEWQFTHVNERAEEFLDRSAAELVDRSIWEVLPGTVDSTFQAEYERAMETQESVSFEEYYPSLEAWFEVSAYPAEDGLSVYFRDVTERKERERELERYETIVETMQDGVYVIDEDGLITQVNETYTSMTGYSRGELVGAHASKVIDDEETLREAKRLGEELTAGERATASLEAELTGPDGETWTGEATFAVMDTDDSHERIGVVRDVSEREERERELRDRVRQQEAVADLGQRALEADDLDALMAESAELVAETLDNDFCKVLDLDRGAEELRLRQGVGWEVGVAGEATVSAVEADSQAAYTLSVEEPVVVSDLATEPRFSGPALLTDHGVRSGISTIIGSPDEPWGILGTHDRDAREFSEHDARFVQSVANILASAIDRHDREQKLVDQREQLAALINLNEVVREITDAVIDQSTREEIEETVCERLAETDSYLFAWVGDVDTATQTVDLRAEADVDGYLDEVTISVDPGDERSTGPTGRALRTGETQVSNDVRAESQHDPWREQVERYGVRSSAAIPIVHENTVYGVLNVYADRPNAFDGQERTVVDQLGEVVGHAIAATERKQALMSDDLVELEFRVRDVFAALDVAVEQEGRITLDHAVPVSDEEFLVYGRASPGDVDAVRSFVDASPYWESVTVRSEGDPTGFEARLSEPPVLSVVASLGGYVESAALEDDDYRMTVHLAPSADVRQVIDAVDEAYPGTELVSRQQIERPHDDPGPLQHRLTGPLTDRQRTALEAAYHAGFFEWPRDASGEDVAEAIGVAPPTFHQHLRKAERKVLDAVFSTPGSSVA